jgi:hypothetical protein
VLLLLLNPGSNGTEPRVPAGDPVIDRFRRAMAAHDVPHIHFGADVGDTPGSQWWRRRAIGGLLTSTKLSEDQLAARLGVVQFVPYASGKWGHGHLRLATQAYAFWRVEQAVEAGAYVIIRGLDLWVGAVPMLLDPAVRARVFEFRNSRNTSMTERNLKPVHPVDGPSPFDRIRDALRQP